MYNDITIAVQGFAGNDATLIENEGKTPFCYFRIGSTSVRGAGDQREPTTQWFTINAYGELAKNCAMSIQKGTPVLVRGRLESETYETREDPPQTRTAQVIKADAVGIELGRGTAQYVRGPLVAEESARF